MINIPKGSKFLHKIMCHHCELLCNIKSLLNHRFVHFLGFNRLWRGEITHGIIRRCQMSKSNITFVFWKLFHFLPDGQHLYYIFFITENLNKMGFWFYWRCHIMRTIPNIMSCLTLHWKQRPTSCLFLEYYVLWKYCCLVLSEALDTHYA